MSRNAAVVSGVLLILLVTVMSGGGFLLEQTLTRAAGFIDDPSVAALQRAGHGHAGVLLVLALWAALTLRIGVGIRDRIPTDVYKRVVRALLWVLAFVLIIQFALGR